MLGISFKERLYIDGLMPERALLRLRRAGIAVYGVKKVEKKRILLSVEKKDIEKVFAIYPNVCYNNSEYTPYTVKKASPRGLTRILEFAKKRVGLLLGGLLFTGLLLFSDGFVCGVDFVGTSVYAREAYAAIEEAGIRLFAPYRAGKEDLICAKLLAIDGVEFCSVKKKGMRLQIEIRTSPFPSDGFRNGRMYAAHTGEILSMTVLRGTALKHIGDRVNAGEPLVGDWFSTEDGGQVRVQVIARVRMSCTWEGETAAATEEEAFAKAYLNVYGADGRETLTVQEYTATETDEGSFFVKLRYETVQTINF